MAADPHQRVVAVLERLLQSANLKAVLLVDRDGRCLAAQGDQECMEMVAQTHFKDGLRLDCMMRDADGSTVVSSESGDGVRFEAVARGSCILTLVSADPLVASRMRPVIDGAKQALESILRELQRRLP